MRARSNSSISRFQHELVGSRAYNWRTTRSRSPRGERDNARKRYLLSNSRSGSCFLRASSRYLASSTPTRPGRAKPIVPQMRSHSPELAKIEGRDHIEQRRPGGGRCTRRPRREAPREENPCSAAAENSPRGTYRNNPPPGRSAPRSRSSGAHGGRQRDRFLNRMLWVGHGASGKSNGMTKPTKLKPRNRDDESTMTSR